MTDVVRPRIYLDTNVFIEAVDGTDEKSECLQHFLQAFRARPFQAVTSEVTLAEVMGKESSTLGWAEQTRLFLDLIVRSDFIDLYTVSRDILIETGDLRRAGRQMGWSIRLPDAIHIATAVKAHCCYMLSSDERIALPKSLTRLDPHGLDCAMIEKLLDA